MAESLVSLLVVALLATQPTASDVERAKAAEARAFEAIESERWCEAMLLFVEANQAAPSVDLTYNAAQAADLAGDRKQALKLYVELVGVYPGSERQAQVNERIAELTALVSKEGEGTACPAAEPAKGEGPSEPPPPSKPTAGEGEGEPGSSLSGVLPWTVVGAGATVTALGLGLAAIGSTPYLGFLDARDKILAAESQGADASALQQQQRDARAGWESWGELTTWAGVATASTGLLIATAGVIWALLPPAPDEDAP